MKNNAIVGNIGHFDNEIDMAEPRQDLRRRAPGRAQAAGTDRLASSPTAMADDRPRRRTPLELGLRHRTPELRDVEQRSRTRCIAQIELFGNTADYPLGVYVLPKRLDEKVARLHLDALGVRLTQLNDEQAEYLDVAPGGPYKPEYYRY